MTSITEMSYLELKQFELTVKQELLKRKVVQVDQWLAGNKGKLSMITQQTIACLQEKLHRELKAHRFVYIESLLHEIRTTILRCSGEWIED